MAQATTTSDPGEFDPSRAATKIADGIWQLDLGFQGRGGVVAAYLLAGEGKLALIETGPSSTLPALRSAIAAAGHDISTLTDILVTHIHLDHAGAAGPLARELPKVTVRVHPFGEPHMVDPTKLLTSATRIYGDQMDSLWSEVAPIPQAQVVPLMDGELLKVGGRRLMTVFTPGHAHHHVAFLDLQSRTIFTGDAGGVRMQGTGYVCPPTPPPDLAPDLWRQSIEALRRSRADRLCLTHFGVFDDVARHLDQLEANLEEFLTIGREAVDAGLDGEALTERLHTLMAQRLGDVHPGILTNLEWATPSYMAALGLLRYEKKRREATA